LRGPDVSELGLDFMLTNLWFYFGKNLATFAYIVGVLLGEEIEN